MTRRAWTGVTGVLLLAAAARLLGPTVADPDLWGHIRFGQRTVEGGLERTDPFSYLTAGREWINHEWLSEAGFAILYDAGGGAALIGLKLLLALAIVAALYLHLIRRGADPLRSAVFLLPSVFLLAPGLLAARPQMFTFLFFAIALFVLHSAEHRSERWLWALPPLFAAWINFHGGVLAGVGIFAVWCAARGVAALADSGPARAVERLRRPVVVGVVAALALLLNPYGPDLPAFLLRTATVPRPDITEWRPLHLVSVPGVLYLAWIAFTGWTVLRSSDRRRPALLAVLVAVVLLPLVAVRHLALAALAVPILSADHFAAAWPRRRPTPTPTRAERGLVLGVTAVGASVLVATTWPSLGCIRIDPGRAIAYPVRAVAWLDGAGASGNMVTFFDWGEYALWHLSPDVKVSMDGRRETVYPDSVYQEYLRFQNGLPGWRDVLERPETDFVLFPVGWPAYELVSLDPRWTRAYADSLGGVFVRAGHPALSGLAAAPIPDESIGGAGACAP